MLFLDTKVNILWLTVLVFFAMLAFFQCIKLYRRQLINGVLHAFPLNNAVSCSFVSLKRTGIELSKQYEVVASHNAFNERDNLIVIINNSKDEISTFPVGFEFSLEGKRFCAEIVKSSVLLKCYFFIKVVEIKVDELSSNKVCFYETDQDGLIVSCNKHFSSVLGYEIEELVNKKKIDELLIKSTNVFSDKQSKVMFSINCPWQGILDLKSKYNEIVKLFSVHKLVSYGNDTKTVAIATKLLDGTFVQHTNKSKDVSWMDDTWSNFFKNYTSPVLVTNADRKILYLNQAVKELVNIREGESLESIFLESDQASLIEGMQNILVNNEFQLELKKKTIISEPNNTVVNIYIGKILGLDNNVYGFLVWFTDITQQVEVENSLSHAQRVQSLGYLSGAIAHDFNNVLTAILGFCDLLLQRHGMEDPSFEHIMRIKQSSLRASGLTQRLLAFSRKQTLKPSVVNLNELILNFNAVVNRLVGADVRVYQKVDNDLWYVKVDPVQIEQVILNLIINAHHAVASGGEITLAASNIKIDNESNQFDHYYFPDGENITNGEYVAIIIKDDGHGIDKKTLLQIFEPFFSTKGTNGTGLGLSTAYGVIKQSGGGICVKTRLGKGSEFVVLLKRHEPTQQEQQILASVNHSISDIDNKCDDFVANKKILLIEDEEAVRLFTKTALQGKGYEVEDFASSLDVINYMKDNEDKSFDLVISDVVIPGMRGPEIVKEIQDRHKNIKVIFVSGFGEEVFEDVYGDSRNFHFIPKPYTLKELTTKVKEVLISDQGNKIVDLSYMN